MANFQLEVLVAVLACAVAALAAVLVYREVRQMQDRITMLAKAAMADAMGMEVSICGTRKDGKSWD